MINTISIKVVIHVYVVCASNAPFIGPTSRGDEERYTEPKDPHGLGQERWSRILSRMSMQRRGSMYVIPHFAHPRRLEVLREDDELIGLSILGEDRKILQTVMKAQHPWIFQGTYHNTPGYPYLLCDLAQLVAKFSETAEK